MLPHLPRIDCLVRHENDFWIEFFLADEQLPEIDWSCDRKGVTTMDSHPIQISIVIDSLQILVLRHVSEETHALDIPVLKESIR